MQKSIDSLQSVQESPASDGEPTSWPLGVRMQDRVPTTTMINSVVGQAFSNVRQDGVPY